jgi:predicted NAD/FAD-binding protein
MRRVAVVGSGISGLSVAWSLARDARDVHVTLLEAGDYFGGHTHTVNVTLDGHTHGVDTGFLVFNERTYPKLIALFAELGIATAATDMSFSVQLPEQNLEWSGSNLNTVFAQRSNLLRPRFWGMLREVLRFNEMATALAEEGADTALAEPIGAFLDRQGFSSAFRDWYLLPMVACIWSCPTAQMMQFPIGTLIRFCHNHGLIQVSGRPRWFTVVGGAKHYVDAMLPRIPDARLNTPVRRIERLPGGDGGPSVVVHTDRGSEHFDDVVLACHSDQALALLAAPSAAEREVLGAIRYHPNRAVLHTDAALLPQRRRAWAAWNYERGGSQESSAVCLHYLINQLQPVPFKQPVVVTLNPVREPRPDTVLGSYDYAHPVFDLAAVAAQQRVPALQGHQHTWFCGAWTRYGFHEDGLMSGLTVVERLRQRWAGAPLQTEAASA